MRRGRCVPGLAGDERALTDVIASILLVGVTMVTMVGLGIVVLATPGPSERVHAAVQVQVGAGPDDAWGTGDEAIRFLHRGGEALPQRSTSVHYSVDGALTSLDRGTLGGAFADGSLSIGEAHEVVTTVGEDSRLAIDMVVHTDPPTLVASRDIDDASLGASP